ncbi:flagellar hook-associated protein FlgL [Zobellella sp. DQSA1]|uniref:flagellar hook-associated protein FlgL n=1 Tax=Zobellella sp. DQSA1 TaxID=3342386 RepID=UPI0035C0F2DD
MRLSTFQFYQNNLNNITGKSGQASQQLNQLSSGLRVQTAADDPVAANGILSYKQELERIARYQSNISLGENRLRREESVLTTAENLTQQVKELMLKANNGSYTQDERNALASELQSRMDELLDLANSRDEFGNYIFAGFQSDAAPFVRDPDGTVHYLGDGGQRELAVGDNVKVALNHDGRLVFGQVPNPRGDFTVQYRLEGEVREQGLVVERARIEDKAAFGDAHPYSITFSDSLSEPGRLALTLTDRDGTETGPMPYEPGAPVMVDGVSIVLKGEARAGDEITLNSTLADGTGQDHVGLFDTMNRAMAWLRQDGNNASGQSELAEVLEQLDGINGHLTRVRADTGIRLQRLDNQKESHADMSLTLEKVRSGMEDLDYAQAIGELNQTMVALQASQSVFGKLQGMSLFNYI